MRELKKIMILALIAAFMVSMLFIGTSCKKEAAPAEEAVEAPEEITVAFSTITLADRFFVRLNDGMEKRANETGVSLILHNPDGDPMSQYSAVENFITQGADVIIVDPMEPNGIMPALQKAKEANIPVMAVDEVMRGVDLIDASVGDDNQVVSKKLGEELLAYMDAHGIEKAYIGVIHTIDSPIEITRYEGFKEVVDANPDRMEIVGRYDAKFSIEEASKGAENLISANPNLNFFYGAGGNYMIGALVGIRSQGVEDRVKMIGWDLSAQLIEAIDQGIYIMAAEQDAASMGREAIDAAIKLAKGEEVERYIYVPVTYVTSDNVDQFRSEYQE